MQCPANKLVITPSAPIPAGSDFKVVVNYTGRPGVHVDGDGATEGWFRNNIPVGDGGFMTTEPVGTMAWMPLNNHPTVKPTYEFWTHDQLGLDDRHRPHGDLQRPPGRLHRQRDRSAVPAERREPHRRLAHLALDVAGADRELPGREQHRQLRR